MNRSCSFVLFLAAAFVAFHQNAVPATNPSLDQVAWEPPPAFVDFQQLPAPTLPRVMISQLSIGDVGVVLEDTPLTVLQTHFGGDIGHHGDAGDSLSWLCVAGGDTSDRWVLWLESGEIDGGRVGMFQWQRIGASAKLDPRCGLVSDAVKVSTLPTTLRLGANEGELLHMLGRPTARHGDTLLFAHEHGTTIHNEPYTVSNTVAVTLRRGIVLAITAEKSTQS